MAGKDSQTDKTNITNRGRFSREVVVDIDPRRTYAVISGDIIGSSKLPPSERADLLNTMKHLSNELRNFLGQSVPLDVDIYAGDAWQLLVAEPRDALRAAIFFRAGIIAKTKKKVDTRLVVAMGKVDFVPNERVSEGDGEAFRLSGRTLKETTGKQHLRFVAAAMADSIHWDATFGLIDAVMKRWSPKQAQAVCGALQGWSHADIAAQASPPIVRSVVTRSLAEANWHAIARVIEIFFSERTPA